MFFIKECVVTYILKIHRQYNLCQKWQVVAPILTESIIFRSPFLIVLLIIWHTAAHDRGFAEIKIFEILYLVHGKQICAIDLSGQFERGYHFNFVRIHHIDKGSRCLQCISPIMIDSRFKNYAKPGPCCLI